jgi:hydroxyacylglutathione hydrolase
MLTVGPLQENAYLVVDDESGKAVLVDPGDEPRRLLDAVAAENAKLEAIWITHAHFDHVGAVAALVRETGVPVWLHPLEKPLWKMASRSAAAYELSVEDPPPPDHDIVEGSVMSLGSLSFDVMHSPGHSPGHVTLTGHGVAFVGDCLFAGSIGRTDLPLSHPPSLANSLEKLARLPDETVVYSGHGPATTIGEEKRTNPFLNGAARILTGG